MHFSTVLSALVLAATSAAALPTDAATTYTTNATYFFYAGQGDPCDSDDAAVQGNITSGSCLTFHTYAILIQALPHKNCNFTVFQGTQNCGDASSSQVYAISAGKEAVCAPSGVYDGGNHQYASGRLTC